MIKFQPIHKWLRSFSDCPACLQPASGLCPVCAPFLASNHTACRACALPLESGELCGRCLKKAPGWDEALAAWKFDGLTRFLIHQFKYQKDRAAGQSLAKLWLQQSMPIREDIDALVSVPMHHRRETERGYNPAQLIARHWSKAMQIPLFHGVKRTRPTLALEGMTRKERRRALTGAFALTETPPIRLALIDDVLTTGATAEAITHLLKQNGCQFVAVWVLARTPLPEAN